MTDKQLEKAEEVIGFLTAGVHGCRLTPAEAAQENRERWVMGQKPVAAGQPCDDCAMSISNYMKMIKEAV